MATTIVLFIIAGGAITLPLLYFFARKGNSNKFLTSVPTTKIASSSISVGSMPVTSSTKKRKGHRGSKKGGTQRDIAGSEKVELKLKDKIIAQPELIDRVTFSKDKKLPSTLPVLASISIDVEKQSNHDLEQEIKEKIVEEQVSWEVVGRKGKIVKKQAKRQEHLLAAQGEATSKNFQLQVEDICHPPSKQYIIDEEVFNNSSEELVSVSPINTSKLDHKTLASSIKQSDASILNQLVLDVTPTGMNNFGRKDSLKSTSLTDESCTPEEDKKSLTSTSPITDPSSVFDEKEIAAALKVSMAELNDGWKTVGPRRRGQKKNTATIVDATSMINCVN